MYRKLSGDGAINVTYNNVVGDDDDDVDVTSDSDLDSEVFKLGDDSSGNRRLPHI